MANAKKCDICGKYFDAPDTSPYRLDYDDNFNFIRLHRARCEYDRPDDLWLHFDSCDECYQDVLDYILGKAAESAK
jgi:hypothetical protein